MFGNNFMEVKIRKNKVIQQFWICSFVQIQNWMLKLCVILQTNDGQWWNLVTLSCSSLVSVFMYWNGNKTQRHMNNTMMDVRATWLQSSPEPCTHTHTHTRTHTHAHSLLRVHNHSLRAPVRPVCVCIFCAHTGMHVCVRESFLWIGGGGGRQMEEEGGGGRGCGSPVVRGRGGGGGEQEEERFSCSEGSRDPPSSRRSRSEQRSMKTQERSDMKLDSLWCLTTCWMLQESVYTHYTTHCNPPPTTTTTTWVIESFSGLSVLLWRNGSRRFTLPLGRTGSEENLERVRLWAETNLRRNVSFHRQGPCG